MIIKEINNVGEEIVNQIRDLENLCKRHDKLTGDLFLDSSLNFNPDMNSLFLLYDDNKLISLLQMFVPTQAEAEISAFTLPEYRQKGYFKVLLERAASELKKFDIPDFLFVCEPQSLAGKAVINSLSADYDFTEYSLKYNPQSSTISSIKENKLELRKPSLDDCETLIDLSQQIFGDSYEDAKSMVMKAFESSDRQQYLASFRCEHIGMAGISFDEDEAYIFGFGVIPAHQGKGYGKAMLEIILKELTEQNTKKIMIEVDSTNEKAFNLYKKCGFEVETAFEYFRKKV